MPSWAWVAMAAVALVAWIVWMPSIAARARIWLDPQYRAGRHVARRSDGRHAATGPAASGPTELIVHRRALHIRRLAPSTARRYVEEWAEVEATFDDDPALGVRDADRLTTMAMLDRGFPVDDLEHRAAELRARHGNVIASYRAAHEIAISIDVSAPSVGDLGRAMIHYRDLLGLLVGGRGTMERRQAG